MAVFRNGVKAGKFDFRVGLSQERSRGILRKIGVLEEKKDTRVKSKGGDVDLIRSIVARGEGFTMPVNFKVRFNCPRGIANPDFDRNGRSQVQPNGLDHKTHILNSSGDLGPGSINDIFKRAKVAGATLFGSGRQKSRRVDTKLDLFCSKVSIPEKTFNIGLYRNYGPPYPYPQSVQYGTLTTTFYCDGNMQIKLFFDAWQKLIYNDLTGNFNYYDEYISDFEVFTRSTVQNAKGTPLSTSKKKDDDSIVNKISQGIQNFTSTLNEVTGVENDPPAGQSQAQHPILPPRFTETYGVKIFECWPQTVGSIDLGHDMTDQIATFDVTWAYTRWNPFRIGKLSVPNRGEINLSVGEFRNEKDGFPFIEDLPPELSGPLSGAINQGLNTSPAARASVLFN